MTLTDLHPWETPETGAPALRAEALRSAIPVLETVRLILRAPRLEDFAMWRAIEMSDRAVFMGGPLNREDTYFDFTQAVAGWLLKGYGYWTITDKSGAVLGACGICCGYSDLEPELGYMLLPEAENKGYATEAVTAARDWAINTAKIASLVSYIDAKNTASINVASKIGGTRDLKAEAAFEGSEYAGDHVYRHWPKEGTA